RRPPLPEKPAEKVETAAVDTQPVVQQEVSADPSPSLALLPELNMGFAAHDNAMPAPAPVHPDAAAADTAAPEAVAAAPVAEAAAPEPV
ncbi:hypothetical protein ABTM52_19775, partial [Acinetobacter baumannii]